jgi:hypothetical protein
MLCTACPSQYPSPRTTSCNPAWPDHQSNTHGPCALQDPRCQQQPRHESSDSSDPKPGHNKKKEKLSRLQAKGKQAIMPATTPPPTAPPPPPPGCLQRLQQTVATTQGSTGGTA